jgi:hypothetical protein
VSRPGPDPSSATADPPTQTAAWANAVGSLGTDWWATIVAGIIVVLAVANVLPKIPW